MAIARSHIPFYEEIFALEGFLADPVLVFGVQDIRRDEVSIPIRVRIKNLLAALGSPHARVAFPKQLRDQWRSVRRSPSPLPEDYVRSDHLTELLQSRGLKDVRTLDLYDPRSDLRYDMNCPVPPSEHGRFHTFIDIGSLEHVFDTRRCLENSLRMIRYGGFYFLHTCVNGYFGHSFHVFNPQAILAALRLNGFEIVYLRYSTDRGVPLAAPVVHGDVLMWVVARKTAEMQEFLIPQERLWQEWYETR